MLEQLLRLQSEGKWLEMRALIPAVFEGLARSDLMKAYALASHAYANSAQDASDWERARVYAVECSCLADANGPTRLWCTVQLSIIYSNTGRTAKSAIYAQAFLRGARSVPAVSHLRPWAYGSLGFAHYLRRDFKRAVFYFRQAIVELQQKGDRFEFLLTHTRLAWALGRSGRITEAWNALPGDEEGCGCALWHGVRSMLLAKEKRWADALREGRIALSLPRRSCDNIDAAEVTLVMAECASHLGGRVRRGHMTHEAAQLVARQACDIETILMLNLRGIGGEIPYVKETRGSSDPHDGASLTSGVG